MALKMKTSWKFDPKTRLILCKGVIKTNIAAYETTLHVDPDVFSKAECDVFEELESRLYNSIRNDIASLESIPLAKDTQ